MRVAGRAAVDKVNSAPANTRDTIANMSQAPYGPGPAGPAPWPPQGPAPAARGASRVPTIIAIVIALIAVAVAIASWFRPAPKAETPAAKTYSEQEIADAKRAVCDAYDTVNKTVDVAGSKSGDNPTDSFVVAINTRLALATSSSFLTSQLSANPATPDDLSEPVRDLAHQYQVITMNQLADARTADLQSFATAADRAVARIKEACR